MTDRIKIAGVQMDVDFADKEANFQKLEARLRETAREGAWLTVFPECALTGYCFESYEEALPLAEPIPGPSTNRMTDLCRELEVHTVFGMLEVDGDRLFNACVLVGPDGVLASYRKIHLPGLGVDKFVTPGDRPFMVHEAGALRLGMNICYDGSFPEAARIMSLEGADLIVLPTNWPPGAEVFADYVINARAMENGVYYAAVNRVGTERGFRFLGRSSICDVDGNTIAEASHTSEAIMYAEIDPAKARRKHRVRVPGKHEIDRFADRRPELYGLITEPTARTT